MKTIAPRRAISWSGRLLQRVSATVARIRFKLTERLPIRIVTHGLDTSEDVLYINNSEPTFPGSPALSEGTALSISDTGHPTDPFALEGAMQSPDSSDATPSAPRTRFANLVRNVIMVHRSTGFGATPSARRIPSSGVDPPTGDHAEQVIMPRSSRVAGLVPKLRNMMPTQDIAAHAALVRHIEVSIL
jgi:hypothetical protein